MFEFINLIWLVIVVLLFVSIVWSVYNEWKKSRQLKQVADKVEKMHEEVADVLLKRANDERPIMLNVSQEKLIDKTIEEIERRKRLGGYFNGK